MSKVGGALSKMRRKKEIVKVIHPPFLRTTIKAGMASPAPPLGPQLGQRGINVAQFCKDFNAKTAHIVEGAPIPTRVQINADRSFKIEMQTPASPWMILRAAGLKRGTMHQGTVVGKISVKTLYEIAKIKLQDPVNFLLSEESMCKQLIHTARTCGVEVVKDDLDPVEYKEFLERRKEEMEKEMVELEEKKAAKMLRTS